jgi:hypothetical protein
MQIELPPESAYATSQLRRNAFRTIAVRHNVAIGSILPLASWNERLIAGNRYRKAAMESLRELAAAVDRRRPAPPPPVS